VRPAAARIAGLEHRIDLGRQCDLQRLLGGVDHVEIVPDHLGNLILGGFSASSARGPSSGP